MEDKTCCFTGHRGLSRRQMLAYLFRLEREVDALIERGVTTFISGGALGFDQMAASLIVAKRDAGCDIRLALALPCRGQGVLWTDLDVRRYEDLLAAADVVTYVSEEYSRDCMRKRNHYMVDRAAYCVCALLFERSGTGQTVRYARQKGRCVINIAVP